MNRYTLSRLDDRQGRMDEEKKAYVKKQVVIRLILLIEDWVYSLMVREPTPPREMTLRLLIVVCGLVLVVIIMVVGGAGDKVDEVIKHLPFLPGVIP
jgi:hypothetical protein